MESVQPQHPPSEWNQRSNEDSNAETPEKGIHEAMDPSNRDAIHTMGSGTDSSLGLGRLRSEVP